MSALTYNTRVEVGKQQPGKPVSNKVSTTKYNVFSFIPKFLFYQYIQPNNIYYLANAIAGYIVYVVSPISNVLPIIFVLCVAAVREIMEDIGRYLADKEQNEAIFNIERCGMEQKVQSEDIQPGDILVLTNNDIVPCDCLLLETNNESGIVNVSTASLDGESNLKPRVALYGENFALGTINTTPPDANMHNFNGEYVDQDRTNYFSFNNVLLKGVKIKTTCISKSAVIFTGMDTRIMKCQTPPKIKSSKLNKRTQVICLVEAVISVALMLILPALSLSEYKTYESEVYLQKELTTKGEIYVQKMIIYFIILAYFLPISLFVTIEFCRVLEQFEFDLDKRFESREMREYRRLHGDFKIANSPFSDLSAVQRSATLKNTMVIENMAELDYIFSDKTGTITKNQMELECCRSTHGELDFVEHSGIELSERELAYMFVLALSNTVEREDDRLIAESPDEVAFCEGAEKYGIELIERQAKAVKYRCNGHDVVFDVLAVIPFSSDRKRMSIILRERSTGFLPTLIAEHNQPFILTKGADSFITPLGKDENDSGLLKISDDFSVHGLRTLIFGHRELNDEFLLGWCRAYEQIEQLPESDEEHISHISLVESELTLDFVSAVEDELEDNVKTCITAFRTAGIKFWMCTGDKAQTAVNIAHSAGLLHANDLTLRFTSNEVSDSNYSQYLNDQFYKLFPAITDNEMLLIGNKFYQNKPEELEFSTTTNFSLVIDGPTFTLFQKYREIHKFILLAESSQAVIGCRLSPADKAQLINFVKLIKKSSITLAVGDGNNDCPMIIAADVGCGIAGKEGLFACNNADVTFTEFEQLQRAIFVYGRYQHIRHSELAEYMIYKNSIIPFLSIIYSFFNKFTVNIFIDSLLLLMFNMFISLFPIFFEAFTDRDVAESYLLAYPELFKSNYNRKRPSLGYFYLRFLLCLAQSLLIVLLTALSFDHGLVSDQGYVGDVNCSLQFAFIPFLISTSLEFCLYQSFYSFFTVGAFAAMLVLTIGCMEFGNYSDSYGSTQLGSVHFLWGNLAYYSNAVVIVIVCIIPSTIHKYMRMAYFPNTTDVARQDSMSNTCTDKEVPQAEDDRKLEAILRELDDYE